MRRSITASLAILIALIIPGSALAQSGQTERPISLGGRVVVSEADYALSVPDQWVVVRPSEAEVSVILAEVGATLPELAPSIEAALGSGLGFSLLALDPEWDPVFTQNCNVLDRQADGKSIDATGAEELGKLLAFGGVLASGPELTFVELPSGRAARLDVGLVLPDFDTVSTSYLLTDGTWVHTLTCTDLSRPADAWLSIAETFEFLPPAD